MQTKELNEVLRDFSKLTPQERKVLLFRYGLEDGVFHTLAEVGKEIGKTRERVRQIEAKAFEKLRIL